MILLIDWGNSRLKYTFVRSSEISNESECSFNISSSNSLYEFIIQLEKQTEKLKLKKALIASVKNEKDNFQLREALNNLGFSSVFAKTSREACGVTCGYEDETLLGVDRWLAILAGYEKGITTGVIDIGSAITLDLVDSSGIHLGGHILPGTRLLKESLSNTANVKVLSTGLSVKPIKDSLISSDLGHSTTECVLAGIESLVKGYLVQTMMTFNKDFNVDRWIITGGDADYWLDQLKTHNIESEQRQIRLFPDLIFKGLIKLFEVNDMMIK